MCPLRIILIFLSATLAGFFVLRNLKSQPANIDTDTDADTNVKENELSNSIPLSSKVCGAIGQGFWTFVDMESGKYLWRNLVAADSSSTSKRAD